MPTLTVYPDADPETTSVDGALYELDAGTDWATLRAAGGDLAYDSEIDYALVMIQADALSNKWRSLARSIFLFDTSALPNGCTISSAVLSIWGTSKANVLGLGGTDFKINVYASSPLSDDGLIAGDFDTLGTTALCDTSITYDDFSATAYNAFTLNSTGLALISKTGITKLGIREAYFDVAGNVPTWAAGENYTRFEVYFAEQGNEARMPKLVITYTGNYPTNPLIRVSGIKRTFWAGIGGQSVYQAELALGGMGTTYVSPIGSREPPSAVTPAKTPSGAGYQYSDYQAWLNYYITYNLAGLIKTFGHIPVYEEWLRWRQTGEIK